MAQTIEIRLTKWKLSLFSLLILFTLQSFGNCRPLFSGLSKLHESTPNLVSQPIENFLTAYDKLPAQKWMAVRGKTYFARLEYMASQLARECQAMAPVELDKMKNKYGRFGKLSGRGKSADSILAKLLRKDFTAFENGTEGITDINQARRAIGDGIGSRLTFEAQADGSINPELIQNFVDQIVKDIKSGTRVTEILNYRAAGEKGVPYLSDAQISQIIRADTDYRMSLRKLHESNKKFKYPDPILVKNGESATFQTGYTAFHMNIEYPNGMSGEFQIRGPLMNEASEIQHLYYDLAAGKVLSPSYQKKPVVVSAAKNYQTLSPENKAEFMKYVEQRLVYARRKEIGDSSVQPPSLPGYLPENLSFERLKPHLIHD